MAVLGFLGSVILFRNSPLLGLSSICGCVMRAPQRTPARAVRLQSAFVLIRQNKARENGKSKKKSPWSAPALRYGAKRASWPPGANQITLMFVAN
jgi:hypothetical protein